MDRERLHARVRGRADHRRPTRRPVRATTGVPHRHRRVHPGVRRGRGRLVGRGARRDPHAQGLFAALMVPQLLASVQALFSPRERAPMYGLIGGVTGLAAVLGPVLGGVAHRRRPLGARLAQRLPHQHPGGHRHLRARRAIRARDPIRAADAPRPRGRRAAERHRARLHGAARRRPVARLAGLALDPVAAGAPAARGVRRLLAPAHAP